MKKLAPLLLVLLAASLWTWTQSARLPLLLPTRANCSVHRVFLGASQAQVFRALGKPDYVEHRFPKGRDDITECRWRIHTTYHIAILQVLFEKQRVFSVEGERLSLGNDDFALEQAQPLQAASFLGSPLSSGFAPLLNRQTDETGLRSTWKFPGLSIEILSHRGHVERIFLRAEDAP